MDDDYSDEQQPAGVYADAGGGSPGYATSQNAPSVYPSPQKSAAPTAPTTSPPAPNTPPSFDPDAIAAAMVETLAGIYTKRYSQGRHPLLPKKRNKIAVKLVNPDEMTAALTERAQNVGRELIKAALNFAPGPIQSQLKKYYADIGEAFPANLQTVDRNTVLTPEQEAVLFARMMKSLLDEARAGVDATQGFYAAPQKEGDAGTIFVRAEFAQSVTFQSDLAGTLAHEMAHAYAHPIWRDFTHGMAVMGTGRSGKLNEGMAGYLENKIVEDWLANQPAKTLKPKLGYTDDEEVADSAKIFIDALGLNLALSAFFDGSITFADLGKR